jgi:hypothetical protein
MKTLKKISVAYALQIFAVIFLLGYAVASPKTDTNAPISNKIISPQINQQLLLKTNQDSLLNEKINDLKRYVVKRW